jgi:acyl dehydratase
VISGKGVDLRESTISRGRRVPAYFDEMEIGKVVSLGAAGLNAKAIEDFTEVFAPGWDTASGAPDVMIYALWAKLDLEASAVWPQTKRLAVDALRWARNPPAGELLRGRMTILGKDPVGDGKGIVIAQHDLLDEAGRLVFSCLTRSLFACRPS